MKHQIKKLCKQLSRFDFYEIASILELPDSEVQSILQELISENVISRISPTEYAYIPKITQFLPDKKPANDVQNIFNEEWISVEDAEKLTGCGRETIRRKCKNGIYTTKSVLKGKYKIYSILKSSIKDCKTDFKNKARGQTIKNINQNFDSDKMFDDELQQKIFDNAQDYNKRHIIKCLNIFKLTNGLYGAELVKMLKDIGEQNPDYKMGYSTYQRWKSAYLRNGITGLFKTYNPNKPKRSISKELLEEFEEIFLNPQRYSMRVSWEILKSRHPEEELPSDKSFNRAITDKYSQEYINKKRSLNIKLPEIKLQNDSKIQTKPSYQKVKDAFDDYLKTLENKKDDKSNCEKGYIKNHLYQYWAGFQFKDITQSEIITYQSKMLSDGYSVASIKRFLGTFQKIIKMYSVNTHLQFTAKDTIMPTIENRILSDKEVLQIVKDDRRIQELWVLSTGVNPAELGALKYTDIDFDNKSVKISKVKYGEKTENIRAKYKIRELQIPDVLINKIPKNQNGLVFEEVKIDNFDILLNTHIKLLLDKQVQINIISKNLGFYKLTDFENRYNFLLPQKLDDGFQIL